MPSKKTLQTMAVLALKAAMAEPYKKARNRTPPKRPKVRIGKGVPVTEMPEYRRALAIVKKATAGKTQSFRAALYERDPLCHWCREPIPFAATTIEHLVRRADGGRTTMENCAIACCWCNHNRGTETDRKKVVALARAAIARHIAKKGEFHEPKLIEITSDTIMTLRRYDAARAAFSDAVRRISKVAS